MNGKTRRNASNLQSYPDPPIHPGTLTHPTRVHLSVAIKPNTNLPSPGRKSQPGHRQTLENPNGHKQFLNHFKSKSKIKHKALLIHTHIHIRKLKNIHAQPRKTEVKIQNPHSKLRLSTQNPPKTHTNINIFVN